MTSWRPWDGFHTKFARGSRVTAIYPMRSERRCPRQSVSNVPAEKMLQARAIGVGFRRVDRHGEVRRQARREQRKLNAIEAQIAVVNAGGQFWFDALAWGRAQRLLTPTEAEILVTVTRVPTQIPSDKQSSKAMEILAKLHSEGYQKEMSVSS